MNLKQLRDDVIFRLDNASVSPQITTWINQAYNDVWNAGDWDFCLNRATLYTQPNYKYVSLLPSMQKIYTITQANSPTKLTFVNRVEFDKCLPNPTETGFQGVWTTAGKGYILRQSTTHSTDEDYRNRYAISIPKTLSTDITGTITFGAWATGVIPASWLDSTGVLGDLLIATNLDISANTTYQATYFYPPWTSLDTDFSFSTGDYGQIAFDVGGATYIYAPCVGYQYISSGLQLITTPGTITVTYNNGTTNTFLNEVEETSKIEIYPLSTSATPLEFLYKKTLTELSAESDEPEIPAKYHELLVLGALARAYQYNDDTRTDIVKSLFDLELKEMKGAECSQTDYEPSLKPACGTSPATDYQRIYGHS